MNKKILSITGRKQSGKDTLGNFLINNAAELFGPGIIVRKFGFADPLKDIVHRLFGIPKEWLNGTEEDKNRLTPIKWKNLPHYRIEDYQPEEDECCPYPNAYLTVRELLQQFGTEIVRKMHSYAWVDALQISIRESDASIAVITDSRFPNEIKAIKDWGGKVIRLLRNRDAAPEHESEWALDSNYFDWTHFDAIIANDCLGIEEQKQELALRLLMWGWLKQGESKWRLF